MARDASELARGLAREAEAVCRHYLSNGKREGRYWLVGDVHNTPGRSLFVRLQDSPKGPAGKWTDAATSEHGDLLDIIRESLGLRDFREVAEEARRFLKLPRAEPQPVSTSVRPRVAIGSQEAARRLFAISVPIEGTIVETYLHRRGIAHVYHGSSLRFHPRCYYRPDEHLPTETWPAMIACVTDLDGRITGVHRTCSILMDLIGFGSARLQSTRRDVRWATCSATRFVLAWLMTTCLSRAKASRPCCRCDACYRACPWRLLCLPITSRPCCCRRVCADSISLAMPMPRETPCRRLSCNAQEPLASRRLPCRHDWATSTKICTSSVSMPYAQRCGYSSHLRTSTASSCPRQRSDSCVCLPSTSADRSRASNAGEGRDHGLLEGDRTASDPSRQWQTCGYFPPRAAERPHITHRAMARFASRSKIAAPLPSSAGATALRCRFRVLARPARRLSDRHEGRDGRGRTGKGLSS